MSQRIIRNIPKAYLAQLVSLGGSFALTFGTAFLMSATARGELAVFMLLGSLGSYAFGLGMPSQILQLSANGRHIDARALFVGQIPVVALIGALGSVFLVVAQPFGFVSAWLSILGMVSAVLGALFNALSWNEYGQGRFAYTTVLRGIIPAVASVAALLSVGSSEGGSVATVAATYVAFQGLAILVTLPRQLALWLRPKGWRAVSVLGAYRAAFGFFSMQTLVLVLNRVPVLVSAVAFGAEVTALVSIAMSLTEVQSSLPQLRSAMTFHAASREAKPKLTKSYFLSALFALVPGTGVVLVAGVVASLVLPAAYGDLWLLVLVLTPGVAVFAVAGSSINILAVRHQSLGASTAIGIAALLQIGGFFVFGEWSLIAAISVWSIITAAVGALIVNWSRRS